MEQRGSTTGTTPRTSTTGKGSSIGSRPMVSALFQNREDAERAYQQLTERGYERADINILMSDETRAKQFGPDTAATGTQTEMGNKAAEGAGVGGAIGGTIGAIAAALAAAGTSIALPGLGLVVAGPLAAALMGAGAGAATGGVVGALIGAGIPEERVKRYEEGLKRGGVVIAVEPRSAEDADFFEREWKAHGGQDVHH